MGDFWWVWLVLAASLALNLVLLKFAVRRFFRFWTL